VCPFTFWTGLASGVDLSSGQDVVVVTDSSSGDDSDDEGGVADG
jgi:hypothetical protein